VWVDIKVVGCRHRHALQQRRDGRGQEDLVELPSSWWNGRQMGSICSQSGGPVAKLCGCHTCLAPRAPCMVDAGGADAGPRGQKVGIRSRCDT